MLNLLNKKSNLIVENKITNFTKNRDDKIGYQAKINRENLKKNSIQYYPSSNKEWSNSIYAFNKSYIKLLVNADKIVTNLFKSYINILTSKLKTLFKRRRVRNNRFSANRIYISRAEMKHTNAKVIITLYTYNKQKYIFNRKIRSIAKNIYAKKQKENIRSFKNHIKSMVKFFVSNTYYNRYNIYFKHELRNIQNMLKFNFFKLDVSKNVKEINFIKYKLKNIKDKHFERTFINIKRKVIQIYLYKREFKLLKKIKNILSYTLKKRFTSHKWGLNLKKRNNIFVWILLNINNTYLVLRKMRNLMFLKKLFLLEEKFFYYAKLLNFNKCKFTNLFLSWKGLGLVSLISRIYNKKVELKIIELKSIHLNSDIFSSAIGFKLRNRKNKLLRVLRKALLKVKSPYLHLLLTSDKNINSINKNNFLNFIKQKVVSGVRFEVSGRLTRRLTASRSIFKYRYKGSLKNIHSSYNKLSSVMIRGHVKSNLQSTILHSKTRNGAFGLKGWVSSY
jgi:Mitochondrial ribosomal protein (VAR1)